MAASNARKIPLAISFNEIAKKKAQDAINLLGKALPASVVSVDSKVGAPIVTVKFEIDSPFTLPQVTIPSAGSEYDRLPLQQGARGVVFPADTFLGGISGLGTDGAPAPLDRQPGNLAALVFFPVGNKNWSVPEDKNARIIYGPNGVILRDVGKTSTFTLTPHNMQATTDNQIQWKVGNFTVTITSSGITLSDGGSNTVVVSSTGVAINGRTFLTHQHSGVQTGSGQSGGVV